MGGFNKLINSAANKGIIKPVSAKPVSAKPVSPKPAETKTETKTENEKEKKASNMLLAKRKGRRYSISTSAKGDLTKVETTKKTLLG